MWLPFSSSLCILSSSADNKMLTKQDEWRVVPIHLPLNRISAYLQFQPVKSSSEKKSGNSALFFWSICFLLSCHFRKIFPAILASSLHFAILSSVKFWGLNKRQMSVKLFILVFHKFAILKIASMAYNQNLIFRITSFQEKFGTEAS